MIKTLRKTEIGAIFMEFLKKLYKDRDMITTMALRDLKARYIGSAFGLFWAIINPLSQVAIYGIVFGVFFNSQPNPVYGTDSFFLYLICGLVPWQFFSQTVGGTTGVILSNRNLIKKAAGFPSEVLPIVRILSEIISHLIALVLLLVILLIFRVHLSFYILLIPVYLFFIALFMIGLGWIFSGINVYIRDIQHIIGVIMTGWFFFTPIFYSITIVPESIRPLIKLNPMYCVVDGYRYALLAGKMPPLISLIYLAFISLLVFGLGGILFRKLKPGFAEVL